MTKLENIILNEDNDDNQDPISDFMVSLRAVRKLQQDKRTHGVNRVKLYFEDVEGDWLENWAEDYLEIEEEYDEVFKGLSES